ncbi:uncharacterized protein TrAFT101_003632 [Trichoderma asperellum]|uniref:uncharacterized protein n=1 Tax=Trichoderma asperellum TaxID=101201 RepID=UPI003321C6C2|nr:hypothetical protein TrAFT101_003632 [Trichoderma asperellum]
MSFNYGKHIEPLHSSRLSSQTRKSAAPRHASYLSSKRHTGENWEDWEDDDVVTLIDVDETPAGDHSDHQKLFTSSPFLNMTASNSAMTTRSPSPLESDSLSVSSNDEVSPIEDDVQTGLQAPPPTPALFLTKAAKHPSIKVSMRRSTARTSRPVSRRPPKQRNAKLGITLITDMTKLRRQNYISNQAKSPARRNPKFADAAALRALEGSPNPQSVGNWNWLRRGNNGDHVVASPSPLQADDTQSPDEQLSPEARPIVIGITLPSDEVESRGIDPLTATVNNIDTPNGEMRNPYPFNFQTAHDRANPPSVPTQLKSMWSPDTPDTASSFSTIRYPSSVYSQASMAAIIAPGLRDDEVPPVPALPAGYKQTTSPMPQRLIGAEQRKNKDEEDESGTPCTLFEEDGITPLKSPASKLSARTPDSVRGWWDHHLVTPFLDMRMSFASRRTQMESPLDQKGHQIAKAADNKGEQSSALTPKSRQSWKTIISKPDTKQISPSAERDEHQNPTTVNVEGGRAILGLSMLEKQRGLSTFSPGYGMLRDVRDKNLQNQSQSVSKAEDEHILITLETEEKTELSDKSRAVNENSTLRSQSDKYQQSSSKFHEMISSETSKSKEIHTYEFVSAEIRERQMMPTDSQPKHEQKRDLTPPPRPQRQEAQAPIIKVPTPRQTPPPREVGMREGSERPIVVHIEINTGEQPQKFVVDRVGLSSTPTIKIPTPRRTPSPQADVLKVGVAAEPARGAFGHHEAGTREMMQGLGITNLRADTPPSPSSKKHAGAAVKYQAVFPPGHHLHTQVPQTEAPHNVASAPAPVALVMTTVPVAYTTHDAHTAAPIAASTTATPTTSVAAERAAPAVSRAAGHETNGSTAVSAGAGVLASQVLHRAERAEISTKEAGSITREASTTSQLGDASLSTRNVEDTSTNMSRSVGVQLLAHEREKQAETQSSTTHPTSEQHSRFSVSPTSSKSPDSERKARVGSGHVRAASNFVTSVLSRQRSPVDHRRGEARAIQPVDIVLEERRAPEALPAAPERAYLTITEIPSGSKNWIRVDSPSLEHGFTEPLPAHPAEASHADRGLRKDYKIERKRLRHEKEEKMARRAGGLWRGRGCVPKKGCFGRPGPEGRKKRRIWCCIIGFLLLLIIILAIILGIVLSRHHGSGNQSSTPAPGETQSPPSSPPKPSPLPSSIWVNLTDYPAMPTGVLTFVGPNNTVAKSDCTEPSTLWSCSLPKDSQASVSPFKPNQPTIIFQIQWDNSTDKAWNVPNGAPPTPISKRGGSNSKSTIDGFNPEPSPPTFDEMWFLGETTDNIQSSQKAGEPTPFFISILESLNDTVKLPSLSRRATASDILNISDIIFPPDLKADGTPAPAVMLPNPVQQPVRLFDRGLPTEHYGFYTYFQRTIFLKSVTALNKSSEGNVPADENGGCSEIEANHLVTWAETRMLVQIWTRKLNSTGSLLPSDGSEGIDNSPQLVQPGTMPYPVTVTLDTHGGDPDHKVVWEWPMDDRQKLNTNAPELLGNNMAAGGTWINHRGSGNATFGGFDGGTGGCKCQWVNWS